MAQRRDKKRDAELEEGSHDVRTGNTCGFNLRNTRHVVGKLFVGVISTWDVQFEWHSTIMGCCLIVGIRPVHAGFGNLRLLGSVQCFFRITNEFCVLPSLHFCLRFTANSNERWPEGNFSILSKIKLCARIDAYIHGDTCVTETHFLCCL